MRCLDRSKQRICYSSVAHRSALKGWQLSHVHVRTADFVFRSDPAGNPLRSAPKSIARVVTLSRPGAVRFLLWWLFLHRRLRSRQRGSRTSFRFSRAAWHSMADHFHGALPVFIRATQVSLSADPSKPFGFGSGRTRQRLSAPSVLKRLRHHTRSTFRCRSKCP